MLRSPWLSCSNTLPLSSSYTVSPHLQPGHLISLGLFVLRKPSVHILLPRTAVIWRVASLFPSLNDAPLCHLAWMGGHLLHLPVPVTCNPSPDGMLWSQWLTTLKVQSYCFHCSQSNYSSWLVGVFAGNLESSVKAMEVLNEHAEKFSQKWCLQGQNEISEEGDTVKPDGSVTLYHARRQPSRT